jgi:ribosome maturation factor RimP
MSWASISCVAMIGGTSDPTLQVMAERPETRQLTIDDCADIRASCRTCSTPRGKVDPIEGAYRLGFRLPALTGR